LFLGVRAGGPLKSFVIAMFSPMLLPLAWQAHAKGIQPEHDDQIIMAKACSGRGIALFLQFVHCSCRVIATLFPHAFVGS
jgi:hypothetical protein